MALLSSTRSPEFITDGVPMTTAGSHHKVPALSSSWALARFEFESGRGNQGMKVLMVEWEDNGNAIDWEMSWPEKSTTLSAMDGEKGKLHRIFFLLAPGDSIPRIVKLSQGGRTIQINPLPAIFVPELGLTATKAGKKGGLHDMWSKLRLSALQKEIEAEMKNNGESIGLEMALQEKQRIEEDFGLSANVTSDLHYPTSPPSLKTSRCGTLLEKLKALKLGTSASGLNAQSTGKKSSNKPPLPACGTRIIGDPLCVPDVFCLGDVAVSSFSLFYRRPPLLAVAVVPNSLNLVNQQNHSSQSGRIN